MNEATESRWLIHKIPQPPMWKAVIRTPITFAKVLRIMCRLRYPVTKAEKLRMAMRCVGQSIENARQ